MDQTPCETIPASGRSDTPQEVIAPSSAETSHPAQAMAETVTLAGSDRPPSAPRRGQQTSNELAPGPDPDVDERPPAPESLGPPVDQDCAREQDPELIEIFLEEANDLLDGCDDALVTLAESGGRTVTAELNRHLHTLKGSARMAGFNGIGALSHAVESLVKVAGEVTVEEMAPVFAYLSRGLDQIRNMVDAVARRGEVPSPHGLIDDIERLIRGDAPRETSPTQCGDRTDADREAGVHVDESSPAEGCVPLDSRPLSGVHPSPPVRGEGSIPEPQPGATGSGSGTNHGGDVPELKVASRDEDAGSGEAAATVVPHDVVRVDAPALDKLVNLSGEVNIYQSRLEQQLLEYGNGLGELTQTIERLRGQLRKLEMETEAQILFQYEKENDDRSEEFDPLELDRYSTIQQLSRALSESVTDLTSIRDLLGSQSRNSETLLEQQSRVGAALQEQLMQTRMVRFGSIARRLQRIVRQTAAELSKHVALSIFGEDNELDRSVLNRMVSPLEHILRNAISHGIEDPGVREQKGKAPRGEVRLGVSREGAEVVIRITDDGGGIDRDAVRRQARVQGLVNDDRELSDDNVLQLILESGFSTAKELTHVSGRGVGMDVVHSEVKKLGGVLSIESEVDHGTTFYVRLPYTLAVNETLLVEAGDELYAVPLTNVEGVVRIDGTTLGALKASPEPVYVYGANDYRLMSLAELVGVSSSAPGPEASAMYRMLLIRAGDRRMAIQVDGLMGTREVVSKPLGSILDKLKGVSGATILGDGRVVLILDVTGLYWLGTNLVAAETERVASVQDREVHQKKLMVVDDSITIRKVTSRLLQRNDYGVMMAKDGVDALQQLQDELPDLILLDIEMPRMDGYELASHIRNNPRLRDIPIIMITSRTGQKHKQRALDIGVDRYLGKPYQEPELLSTVREMLGEKRGGGLLQPAQTM